MKLRTIVKIAITSSVVLLCSGFALYSYFKLSATQERKKIDLYTLVPLSASAVFATDDVATFVTGVDGLACSKNNHFLYISKIFSYLKQYLYTFLDGTPHGSSREMSQVLISFHEPDNDRNQVLYCRLGTGDRELVNNFVQKYISVGYPPKAFVYKGESIMIYTMVDGGFLACYMTPDFLVLSCQIKLVEEVINVYKGGKSLSSDLAFRQLQVSNKSNAIATLFTRVTGLMGWTKFDMKLKENFIYFSGACRDVDSSFSFINMLSKQEVLEGFPGEYLPSTTYYFSRQSVVNWDSLLSLEHVSDTRKEMSVAADVLASNKIFSTYLMENAGNNMLACLFYENDTTGRQAEVLSIPVFDIERAEKNLRYWVSSVSAKLIDNNEAGRITLHYTPDRAYSIYKLPLTTLFNRLSGFIEPSLQIYAVFYRGTLLLAPNINSLSSYIDYLDKKNILYNESSYRVVVDGLSDSYNFMLMTDFSRLLPDSQFHVRYVPSFFLRNSDFFSHFIMFVQLTCTDGLIYPNIVLKYKADE